ncbi:MAG: aminopeptidase [Saprospiraceae bacterium]|nr:aminopeptidase [Saprospiraceae bacterium]
MARIKFSIAFTFVFLFVNAYSGFAQYVFETKEDCQCTKVKSQDRTGTCWSFSTVSFLESELLRQGKGAYDLSEMQIVRTIYQDKARNYVLRQGKANFSQGSLAHDVIRAMELGGLIPESVYSGKLAGQEYHDHSEMEVSLKEMLDKEMAQDPELSQEWSEKCVSILNTFMGEVPETFEYMGVKYTPESFAASLPLKAKDYVSFTSFTHHPFYKKMILEVPDNYSNGSYFNIPMEELEEIVDYALANGMTVSWDGDVSEDTFNATEGLAILPMDPAREDLFVNPGAEVVVTQEMRQAAFMSYATTDDHLMHIVGSAIDQQGHKYYIVKNSWGKISPFEGYLYMSAAYFDMKTVGILVHKDAVPAALRDRLHNLK